MEQSPRKNVNRTDDPSTLCGWNVCEDFCKCCRKQMTCCDGIVAHRIALRKTNERQMKLPIRNMRTRMTTETQSSFTTCLLTNSSHEDHFVHFSDVNAYIKKYRARKNGDLDVRMPTPAKRRESESAPACPALEDRQLMDLSRLTLASVRVKEFPPEQRASRRLKKKTQKAAKRDESTRSQIIRNVFKRNEATQQKFRWLSAKPCKFSSVPTVSQSIKASVILSSGQRWQSAST